MGVDLHSFTLELKKRNEVEQPVVSIEETQNHEGNEVNLDLPLYAQEKEVAKVEDMKEKKAHHLVLQIKRRMLWKKKDM